MKILDRYLIQEFVKPFAGSLLVFCVLVVLGRFFDKMQVFTNYHTKTNDVVLWLLLGLPFWLNIVLPVATLLALLFSLGLLHQRGEITACRSAGIATTRLLSPFFSVGLAISLLSLAGGLFWLPQMSFQARKVYRVQIKKGEALNYKRDNVIVAGRNHRRFTIGWLDGNTETMKDVVIDRFGDDLSWQETITAREARYEAGQWRIFKGNFRYRDPNNPELFKEELFEERVFPIPDRPRDFLTENKDGDDMTLSELVRRIKRLRLRGTPSYRERVALHVKFALPFANMIVIALGIPFALRSREKGRAQTFGYALVIAFLYWGLMTTFQSLGEQGRVAPWAAAWMANFLFAGIAFWRIRRANV